MLTKKILTAASALLCSIVIAAAQEEPKKPDPVELAEKETERLEKMLKLEDWQVFYIDSTLVTNYTGLLEEMDALNKARVENTDIYMATQDKWMERNEAAYRKFFTEDQWKEYLKQGGERIIKDRQKRRDKAAGIEPEKKNKKKKNR